MCAFIPLLIGSTWLYHAKKFMDPGKCNTSCTWRLQHTTNASQAQEDLSIPLGWNDFGLVWCWLSSTTDRRTSNRLNSTDAGQRWIYSQNRAHTTARAHLQRMRFDHTAWATGSSVRSGVEVRHRNCDTMSICPSHILESAGSRHHIG